MKNNKYNNIFPRRLTLTREGTKLKFKAFEDKVNGEFIELLRKNKVSIFDLLKKNHCNSIELNPLAKNQKSLWFISQLNPSSSAYNVGIAIKIFNGINISILKNTLSILIKNHWPLRSHIFKLKTENDFELCQVAPDNFTPFVNEIEDQFNSEKDLIQRINNDNNLPFNLEAAPLFRTFIYIHQGVTYLLFSFHHIICDAISLQIFSANFSKIYETLQNDNTYHLETGEKSYVKFIFDQYHFLQNSEGKSQVEFWKDYLENTPQIIDLPTDFTRPKVHQFNGNTIHFKISGRTYKKIIDSATKHKVTLSTYLFTIYEILLAEFSKQKSFSIGLPVSARTDSNYKDIFGYLINTLPIPCKINSESSFGDILNDNSQNILNALENQNIPFSEIVEVVAKNRDLSRTPVFQVLYNFLNKKSLGPLINFLSFDEEKRRYGVLDVAPIKLKDQEGQFDITLEIFDNDESLNLSLKYNTDIFSELTANTFIDKFKKLLDEIHSSENYELDLTEKKEERLSINITGTFTTEPLEKGLNFWLRKINLPATINFVGFNQVYQQLLDPASKFNTNTNQVNIVILRVEDFFPKNEENLENATTILQELKESIKSHVQNNPSNKLIVMFCPPSDHWAIDKNLITIQDRIETEISNISQTKNNIIVVKTNNFLIDYNLTNYYEALGEEQGNIPYRDNFFACASTIIARKINAIYTSPFKAIVMDCDNTLWQGVVGEDGASGVTIGEAEKKLQQFLIDQNNKGVLLCLCSKNNEEDVWEVFEKNKQMLLERKHISFSRINWNPKSENIISLSNEINIGLESFVFIDDNPIECEEVKTKVPSVLTMQKRTDTDNIDYIINSWAFDRNSITEEDKKRAELYKIESTRLNLKSRLKTYDEFINSLQIKISFNPASSEEISRISQLTFRTNQFNFIKIQRTESQIESLLEKPEYHLDYINLKDKYGDYGIIGVIISFEKEDSLNIDTFLISCRAFGKGVEHAMISHIGEKAKAQSKKSVEIPFYKTEKNIVAEKFLHSNFSQYKSESDNGLIFHIPTDIAYNVKFDPTSIQMQDEDSNKNQNIELKPNIIDRNNFFNDVIDNYSNVDLIVQNIYGTDSAANKNTRKDNNLSKSKIEIVLLEIWQKVLDNPDIKVTDNFFDIGGESILIPNIVIRIKNDLG